MGDPVSMSQLKSFLLLSATRHAVSCSKTLDFTNIRFCSEEVNLGACHFILLPNKVCRSQLTALIGGQDLLRGHNGMLTWVTCVPSTRHWGPSMAPHIRPKPLYPLRMEVPYWQTRKPFSTACQSISKASSVTDTLCRSLHGPRFPKWTLGWNWMTHPLAKRSRKPQGSWRWASHLALMAFWGRSSAW